MAPGKIEYRKLLADISAQSYDLDGAAAQYEELIARDSSNVEAWYNLARVYQVRKPLKALETYEHITARFGPEWDVLLQTADLCNKLGYPARAASALRQMVDLDPATGNCATRSHRRKSAREISTMRFLCMAICVTWTREHGYQAEIAGVWLMKKDYPRAAALFDPDTEKGHGVGRREDPHRRALLRADGKGLDARPRNEDDF